jgi:hypothetical protein
MLLRVQALPVALLALGLGTPSVSRDRAEDVLYLYAVRPVTPWTYTAGKLAAVVVPTVLLLLVPSLLIVALREGILGGEVSTRESALIAGKSAAAALLMGLGYAGVSVGPSALMRRARWALLLALVIFGFPEPFKIAWGRDAASLGPASAAQDLLEVLFQGERGLLGIEAATVLVLYALLGAFLTRARVQREMTP